MDDVQLFKAFYAHVTGGDVSTEQEGAFVQVVDDLRRRERETPAAERTREDRDRAGGA
jgi:hypothetical protein